MTQKEGGETKVPVKSVEGARSGSREISLLRPRELQDIDRWLDEFDRRFEFGWPFMAPWFGPRGGWPPELTSTRRPFADIIDSGDEYHVSVEVPGIPKERLKVTVSDREATVEGEARTDVHEEKQGYVRRERGYSRISRALVFPETVVAEKAEASVSNGVLELRVPKKEPVKPAKHRVAVK